MSKSYFQALLFTLLPFLGIGQYLEAGLMVGASNYWGDLSNNSSTVFLKETGFSGGIFGRYNITDLFSTRLAFSYGTISGDDANSSRRNIAQRNLDFKSNIIETTLTFEFNILGYQPYNLYRPFSPYLFVGIGGFHFNPKADFGGEMVALQPLATEAQGAAGFESPYSRFQINIPMGLGVKYAINDSWNLGLELGLRKTFTDYLDDVSTVYVDPEILTLNAGPLSATLSDRTGELENADPSSNPIGAARGDDSGSDWYYILGFSISYNFMDNGLVGSRGRVRRKAGCKTD